VTNEQRRDEQRQPPADRPSRVLEARLVNTTTQAVTTVLLAPLEPRCRPASEGTLTV
jgi:hypothetical protein